MPYGLIRNGELFDLQDMNYLLSPQDLCGLEQVEKNIYIAASNKDCDAPTNMIFGSSVTTLMASRIVGSLCSPSEAIVFSALFSFQRSDAKIPPAARNPMESSNGPEDPRAPL